MSRLKMMTDLVNRLLMISDPVMLEYVREKSLKNREVKELSPEVQAMLAEAENYNLDEWVFENGVFRNNDRSVESDDEEIVDGELGENVGLLRENVGNITLDQNDGEEENNLLRDDENESFADVSDNESDQDTERPWYSMSQDMDIAVPSTSGLHRESASQPVRLRGLLDSDESNEEFDEPEVDSPVEIEKSPNLVRQRPKRIVQRPKRYVESSSSDGSTENQDVSKDMSFGSGLDSDSGSELERNPRKRQRVKYFS